MKTVIIGAVMLWGFASSCSKDIPQPKEISASKIKLHSQAKLAQDYCKKNNMNTDFGILIDMSIHSGKNRFYLYDYNKEEIIRECLVSHGCGVNMWSSDDTKSNPSFSNVQDSHLSSLGKYKIGEKGYSMFGVHTKYLLHGLDETNSNACKRDIVFHSWDAISDEEVYPAGTPEGWGCPAISNDNFRFVHSRLQNHPKSTLMWIYKS
jgi:hypothetical protein